MAKILQKQQTLSEPQIMPISQQKDDGNLPKEGAVSFGFRLSGFGGHMNFFNKTYPRKLINKKQPQISPISQIKIRTNLCSPLAGMKSVVYFFFNAKTFKFRYNQITDAEKLGSLTMQATIFAYCFWAYFFTWGAKFLISAIELDWIPLIVPRGIPLLLAHFGPTLAGLIIIYHEKGKAGIFSVIKSLTRFKLAPKWYMFALFFELILFFIIAVLAAGTGFPDLEINRSLVRSSFWIFFVNTIHLTLLTGLGEEIGWRGFLLPKLQSRFTVMTTAFIIALIHSFWHLRIDCLMLLLQGDWFGFSTLYVPNLGLRILISIPVSFIIIYLFNKTHGSLLLMTLFHGTSNASYEWLKYMSGSNDPAVALPVFAFLLCLTSLYFIPAIMKQGKNGELRTFIS